MRPSFQVGLVGLLLIFLALVRFNVKMDLILNILAIVGGVLGASLLFVAIALAADGE